MPSASSSNSLRKPTADHAYRWRYGLCLRLQSLCGLFLSAFYERSAGSAKPKSTSTRRRTLTVSPITSLIRRLTETFSQLVTLSSLPLKGIENNFAVDSSGFSTCRFVRWFNKKYGREIDNREWVKVHLMCGVETKIVTSVDVSGWAANDTTVFCPTPGTDSASIFRCRRFR